MPRQHSHPQPPLLALPGELRNTIVSHLLVRSPGTTPPCSISKSSMALSWTCRQLYTEFSALTRSSSIYTIAWHSAAALASQTAELLTPALAAQMHKLQILLPLHLQNLYLGAAAGSPPACLVAARRRVKPFEFAQAGLGNLRELYFRFQADAWINRDDDGGDAATQRRRRTGVPSPDTGAGGRAREFTAHLLWRLVWEKNLTRLTKICIVHDGAQPLLSLPLLYSMLVSHRALRLSRRWAVQSDFKHGRLLLVEKASAAAAAALGADGSSSENSSRGSGRVVEVRVGYSFREAEQYVAVCGEILEVCVKKKTLLG